MIPKFMDITCNFYFCGVILKCHRNVSQNNAHLNLCTLLKTLNKKSKNFTALAATNMGF